MRYLPLTLSMAIAAMIHGAYGARATNTALRTIATSYGVFALGKKPYPPGTRETFIRTGRALGSTPASMYASGRSSTGYANNSSGLPPIGNQGSEGSCTAWAGVYAVKTYYMKRVNPSLKVTLPQNQASPRFAYNLYNGGNDIGGYGHEPFEVFMRYGCASLAQKPYVAGDFVSLPFIADYIEGLNRRTTNYVWLWQWEPSPNEIEQLKLHLDNGGVAAIGIHASDSTFQNWGGGGNYTPWNGSACTFNDIDHMVCVCGYGAGSYLVANSWGTSFGSNGFIYISSNYFERYISDCMFPIEGTYAAVSNYATIAIEHQRRSDITDVRFFANGTEVPQFSPAIEDLPGSGINIVDTRRDLQFVVDVSGAPWSIISNTFVAQVADTVSTRSGTFTNLTLMFQDATYTSPNPPVPIGNNDGTFASATIALPGIPEPLSVLRAILACAIARRLRHPYSSIRSNPCSPCSR